MNLGKIKSAVERADHFEVDSGDGAPFRVAKAALSPHLVDRVRQLYCGGKVQHFVDGGVVGVPAGPRQRPGGFWDTQLGLNLTGVSTDADMASAPAPAPAPVPMPAPAPVESEPERRIDPARFGAMFGNTPAPTIDPEADRAARLARARLRMERSGLPPPIASIRPGLASEYYDKVGSATGLTPDQEQLRARDARDEERAAGGLGTVALPPGGADLALPSEPPAARDLGDEARAAGVEAARKIAEAGDAAKRSLDERAAAEAQARAAEMSAAEGLVRAQDEATRRAELEAERQRDVYTRGENALRLQKEKLASREKELLDPEAMRIETGRVFSRADPVGLMIGAMMVGAAEAGLRKGSGTEAALKVIGDAIDRDVLAQKTEKGAIQSARFQAYQTAVGDVNNAGQLLKADQQLAASAAARLEAQRTQGAQGRLMLTQLANSLSAQARKTAEDAVQLITGQALAQQKAAGDAEGRTIQLRQAEAAIAQSAAQADNARRDDARADASLDIARAQLGLSTRKTAMEERASALQERAATEPKIDFDMVGKMGYGLKPEQWARVNEKASSAYVQTIDDTGAPVYRRARNEDSAKAVAKAQMAAELAKNQLTRIEKYIPGPGKAPPSRMFWTEEARRGDTEVEAATKALTTQIKEIEQLGALTGADLELVVPRIPTAQAWFTSDEAEQQQATDLKASIDEMVAAIMRANVAAPPGGWPKKQKGGK